MADDTNSKTTNPYTDPVTGKFRPGNPGKPKGTRKAIAQQLADLCEGVFNEHWQDAVASVMQKGRPEVQLELLKWLADRFVGKPGQSITFGFDDDENIPDVFRSLMSGSLAAETKGEDDPKND